MRREKKSDGDLTFTFGHDEIVLHRRYEILSMINDMMIGLWFLVGSFCFFYDGTLLKIGTWLFVIGSAQLLIRPGIQLARSIHLKHLPARPEDL